MKNVPSRRNGHDTLNAGTPLDGIISHKGGTPPGTNYMIVGAPGTGKSTIGLDYLALLQRQGRKVLYINAEMNIQDMAEYCERYPDFRELPILFLTDSFEEQKELQELLSQTINEGYDLILIDSWVEVIESIKISAACNHNVAEKWLMQLLMSNNDGKNLAEANTSFFIIQHMTKAGDFAGTNRMKHITTGMMHLNFEEGENSEFRYIEFSKNRRGKVNQRLYYYFDEQGRHWFDGARMEVDRQSQAILKSEKSNRKKEETEFDEWLSMVELPARPDKKNRSPQAPS